jgi:hypothetical protein
LTFCVKRDLYVRREETYDHSELAWPGDVIGKPWGRAWTCWGQAGCETDRHTEGLHEAVRLSRGAHASRATRPLAVPSLALPPRPALAGAGQVRDMLVLDGANPFAGGPEGL